MARKPAAKKAPKASKNPIGDFLKTEADKRKLPVVVEQKPKTRGNPNRANPPKVINQGHTPGSASRAVVPYEAPASKLAGVARTVGRVAGPIGIAVSMVTDSTPAGAGSDKPKGPLMQGTRMRTRPEKPGSYPAAKPKAVGARPETPGAYPAKPKAEAPKTRRATTPPYAGLNKASATTPAATPKKAATDVPKPTAKPSKTSASPPKPIPKPSFEKGPASKTMAYTIPGAKKRGNVISGKNDPMGPRKDASGKNANYGFKSVKDLLRGKRAK